MLEKIWLIQEADQPKIDRLMNETGIDDVLAKLLVSRGVDTAESYQKYFHVSYHDFHNPNLLSDMDLAVNRVLKALELNELVVIYGDYDVDGVTSTSVLYMFLEEIGARVDYYIPDRHEEGYGINEEAIDKIKDMGASLMISVDTGITAVAQVAHASEIGLDVIITDHHECQEALPEALAVINPKKPGDNYPFKELAGVGVTFKLVQALAAATHATDLCEKYLDIVAVGTVADIVPLRGENRIITRLAFETIPHSWNPGLKALLKVADLEGKKMTAGRIGFGIGPRLNAAGRIKHAKEAVELFISRDPKFCLKVAEELDQTNKDRQNLEREIYEQAVNIVESTMNPEEKHILVVASDHWHHGVIGIVASKLVEKYYRPVIILAIEDGIASGSARSVEGFSIFDALYHVKDIFLKFGGHEMAAGMSLESKELANLDQRLNDYASNVMAEDTLIPKIKIDLSLTPDQVTLPFVETLASMEPYGIGNPAPSFAIMAPVKNIRKIGKDQSHLKVSLGYESSLDCIGFSMADACDYIKPGIDAEIACNLEINEWQNKKSPQAMVKDIRIPLSVKGELMQAIATHHSTEYLHMDQIPFGLTKEDYRHFYKYLLSKELEGVTVFYYTQIMEDFQLKAPSKLIRYFIMLEVFLELNLLTYSLKPNEMEISLSKGKKVDLQSSKLYNKFLR